MDDHPSLRDARPGDAAAIAILKAANWAATYGPLIEPAVLQPFLDADLQLRRAQAMLADANQAVVVAVARGELIGFGVGDLTTGYVDSLQVGGGHRSAGTGHRLLVAVARRLREAGCQGMALHVVQGNDRACRFYERVGGQRSGSGPADWEPTVQEVAYAWTDLDALIATLPEEPRGRGQ